MKSDQIDDYLEKLRKAASSIEEDLVDITFFMRGGITLNEAFQLTPNQREAVSKRVKQNFELTEKTKMPLY